MTVPPSRSTAGRSASATVPSSRCRPPAMQIYFRGDILDDHEVRVALYSTDARTRLERRLGRRGGP